MATRPAREVQFSPGWLFEDFRRASDQKATMVGPTAVDSTRMVGDPKRDTPSQAAQSSNDGRPTKA